GAAHEPHPDHPLSGRRRGGRFRRKHRGAAPVRTAARSRAPRHHSHRAAVFAHTMTAPNFILVGAPKCGTTALAGYLRAHPRVFMCVPKEPHYFAVDLPSHRYVSDWDAYQALFRGAGREHVAIGEASIFYMYSEAAITGIRERLPSARLLVMLRNPVELAISMHAQALRTRDETITDFAAAWSLCADRRAGSNVPPLGLQLQRLLDVFQKAQVGWWFLDDFAA